LSQKARDALAALGVEVRTGTAVTECTERHVAVGTERIAGRHDPLGGRCDGVAGSGLVGRGA
jgi:hypothetical protein